MLAHKVLSSLCLALLTAGCVVSDEVDESSTEDAELRVEAELADLGEHEDLDDHDDHFEDDFVLIPNHTDGDEDEGQIAAGTQSEAADGTPQVVYLNFDGPIIKNCTNPCSDAPTNRSWAIGALYGKSAVDFASYTNSAARTSITMRLRDHFKRYKVNVVTSRPTSGKYTMVVITPSWGPNFGAAPLDCGNSNRNDIAFVMKIGSVSSATIARYVAHELGHSFGLAHVKNTGDFMQWASSGSAWTKAYYDTSRPSGKCMSGSLQDANALLVQNIGYR